MLSSDQARVQLAAFRALGEGQDPRVTVVAASAPRLSGRIADAMVSGASKQQVAAELDRVSTAEREEAFLALSPALGADLARWWEWAVTQPYQRGWVRKAFRSSDPADSRTARWNDLHDLLRVDATWRQPIEWHAAWGLHTASYLNIGSLLASSIAHGRSDVRDTLVASVRGEHPVGGPWRQGFAALLATPDPQGWAQVEQLLVAAERSEGLRQSILEATDLAHPGAFARLLDVITEHGLLRFAATVRAVGVWFGEGLDVRDERSVSEALRRLGGHLGSESGPRGEVDDALDAYLRGYALGVRDVAEAVPVAESLLDSPDARLRLAGARVLAHLQVDSAVPGLVRALADPDLRVYAATVGSWQERWSSMAVYGEDEVYDIPAAGRQTLRARIDSLGGQQQVETGMLGLRTVTISREQAADTLIRASHDTSIEPSVIQAASVYGRQSAATRFARHPEEHRAELFSLFADRSSSVRACTFAAVTAFRHLTDEETAEVERVLRLKASDLRMAALTLLRAQPAAAVAASVDRLGRGNAEQKRAAAELAPAASADDEPEDDRLPSPTIAFGPAEVTAAVRPEAPPTPTWHELHAGAQLVWSSLTAWLAEHADTEVRTRDGVELLSNLQWAGAPPGELPLPEIIGPWWERTAPALTDGGLETALPMLLNLGSGARDWASAVYRDVAGPVADEMRNEPTGLRQSILVQVSVHAVRPSWQGPLVGVLEALAAALPSDHLHGPDEVMRRRGITVERSPWGNIVEDDDRDPIMWQAQLVEQLIGPADFDDHTLARLWRVLRFLDEPEGAVDRWRGPRIEEVVKRFGQADEVALVPDQPYRYRLSTDVLVEAFTRGVATRADLLDALLAPATVQHSSPGQKAVLTDLTRLRGPRAGDTRVQEVLAEVREAIVAAETSRGDLRSPFSDHARELRTTTGAEHLVRCLAALGKRPFPRSDTWDTSLQTSLSHLIRINHPSPQDSADDLGRRVAEAKIPQQRLVETAVYAPQWAVLIEEHLGWPGLGSAIWWVHAHTKDEQWSVDPDIRAAWASEVSQRTPLSAADLVTGAADVTWFSDVIAELGEERFDRVLKAAKYASSSGGHKRATLFAEALLGRVTAAELVRRIADKRHQDSVRALGLVPVGDSDDAAILQRYELLRGFVASDRTSGSMRRASESAAVAVGLDNLARRAGYRDPQRLVWAMEAQAVRDLSQGGISATDGDLTVSLSIDESGAADLRVRRGDKPLKSVPATSAKVPAIAELKARQSELRAQTRRMRTSLEDACVLGDPFDGDELAELLEHPVLAPMLRDVVLVDDSGHVGFPVDAATLADADGTRFDAVGRLRVAHPVDLLGSGAWPDLQHAVMAAGRRQPFKQLFRELYTLNRNELGEQGVSSRRYSGQQVQARPANGLFTSRGWVADFETGFSRTFHQQRITAWCHLSDTWGTPGEVEDTTIEDLTFHPAGQWSPLPLHDVPGRVFSETMRDLDLVVSVAHSGGVDPETSESSVEMRARLTDETATLLGLDNVEVGGHHARVKGTLGTYSVHLGSGQVHRIPGNAVCMVPVSAQHRGRIFLPFADDDPRTAEIVAKVVMLARDATIKDPTIVEQLVR